MKKKKDIHWEDNEMIQYFATSDNSDDLVIEDAEKALQILQKYLLPEFVFDKDKTKGQQRFKMVNDILSKYSKKYTTEIVDYKKWDCDRERAYLDVQCFEEKLKLLKQKKLLNTHQNNLEKDEEAKL